MSQLLGALWPFTSGAVNSQRRAAWRARSAKYLLGPGASSSAWETFLPGSTWTRTVTRTLPWIVPRAFSETSGKTWSRTSPCAGEAAEDFGALADGNVSVRSAAGAGAAAAADGERAGADELGGDDSAGFFSALAFSEFDAADFAGAVSRCAGWAAGFDGEAGCAAAVEAEEEDSGR